MEVTDDKAHELVMERGSERNDTRPCNVEHAGTDQNASSTQISLEHDQDAYSEKIADLEALDITKPTPVAESYAGKGVEQGKGATEEVDSNIVWWDGPDDPENPRNWTARTRWGIMAVVSFITFITPLASSMFAPGILQVQEEFHSNNELLASFVVSVYVLGFAAGPLVLASLSEMYGRLPVYFTCNILFIGFTVACAESTSLNMLIGMRFLAGAMGSCPLTLGGGTIADVIEPERRGLAMALFSLGPIIGPVIGPVGGGFLIQAKGWRWVFWLLTIVSGFGTLLCFFVMKETYAVTILERKTRRLQKSTGNPNLRSKLHRQIPAAELIKLSLVRPMRMLFNPIVFCISLFMATVYGYMYLLFTTYPTVFEGTYGFTGGTVGLSYMGFGIGSTISVLLFARISDRLTQHMSGGGVLKPEYRLPPMVPGSLFVPIGLFWYGWSTEAKVHWIVPIIGTGFIGFGLTMVFMPGIAYLIEAFDVYAASAIAANTVLRSLGGALLPLAGRKMYAALGLGWGNSLLAFIALAMCPFPLLFYKFGERIRTRFPVKL